MKAFRVSVLVLLASSACAFANEKFATTVPAKVGDTRYVRASYTRVAKQSERIVLRGRVTVGKVDERGNELAAALEVERAARVVDGFETELAKAGKKLSLARAAGGKIEFADETRAPLPDDSVKWLRYVAGLRGGRDDLDFWDGERVAHDRLRKIIATTTFDQAAVRSDADYSRSGELAASLSMPSMTSAKVRAGTFAVECRWRVADGRLERFRRTRWVLHDPDERVVEIVGIESATPDAWWAKSEAEVRAAGAKYAATNDPLIGFYQAGDGDAAERDSVTELLKLR